MKQRTSSLPVVVVIAVIALVLGSIGTAVAAPVITKSKVKKIAAKVVAQKAPTLSVANANTLAGKSAASYLNASTVYTSTTAVAATSHTVTLPLAPGNYTFGYSVLMTGGSGYTFCQMRRVRGAVTLNVADDTVETTGIPSVSAYGAFDVVAGDVVSLRCFSATAFTISATQPAQIVVTPVDTLTNGGAIAATRGGSGGRGN